MFLNRVPIPAYVRWPSGGEREKEGRDGSLLSGLKGRLPRIQKVQLWANKLSLHRWGVLLRGNPCRRRGEEERILAEDEWRMLENSIERPRTINVPAWPAVPKGKIKLIAFLRCIDTRVSPPSLLRDGIRV